MSRVIEAAVLASGARTTTQTLAMPAAFIQSSPLRVLTVSMDTTVFGTGSVTLSIQFWDQAAGAFRTVLSSAAVVATGYVSLTVGPECVAAANAVAVRAIPMLWQVVATANNANSQTYSISAVGQSLD